MRGYKIVQEDGKWLFQLFPNNNNEQEVGRGEMWAGGVFGISSG